MELNITLGIQILNFFIAWFLLHVFYFKPAIEYMQLQQKAYDQLLEALSIWQGRVVQKEHDINLIWYDLNRFVMSQKPEVIPDSVEQIRYLHVKVTDSDLQHDPLIKRLKEMLVAGIGNADA